MSYTPNTNTNTPLYRRSLNHPTSSLEAADLIRIDRGQKGLLRLSVIRDVDLLLATFGQQVEHLFQNFINAWETLNFSNIHYTSIDKETRPSFMQAFYDEFLEYFVSDVHYLRIGAVYGLYCMFISQPSITQPCPIRVNRDQWRIMFQFYIDGVTSNDKEHASASYAFKQLLDQDAFIHVIQTKMESAFYSEIVEFKNSNELLEQYRTMRKRRIAQDVISACRRDDAATRTTAPIDELSAKYQKAKSIACMTPQATLAAQDMLHSLTGVKETNPRLLHNVLAKSSLSAVEEDFTNTLDNASKAMWISRKKRLEEQSERPLNNKRKKNLNNNNVDTSNTSIKST